MSSISVSSLVLGSLTVEVDGSDSTLVLSVLSTAPASLTIELGTPGPSGVLYATAPLTYDGSTWTVGMDTSYFLRSPAVAATDGQIPAWDAATSRSVWIDNAARTLFLVGGNKTGATIPKGAVVYVSGGQGATPIISLAQANAEATSARTIGIASAAIANNAQGNVVVAGLATKLDTSAYSEGQTLYLSPTTPGGYVTSLPTQPYHGVVIGYVTRSNNSNGVIEVHIQNYQELQELSDVLITSKTNGDLLTYNSASGVWVNSSVATLGLLTTSAAASTYQPIGSYLTDAPSDGSTYGRLNGAWSVVGGGGGVAWGAITGTITDQTDLVTYVTGLGYLTDAPSDGNEYVRKNAAWAIATGGGGSAVWGGITGTVTDQTDLVTYVTGLGYQTASDVSTYVSANAYPLTGNPSGFLTSVPGKSVNTLTGSYTLVSTDANNIVYCPAGAGGGFGLTLTIPDDATYSFAVGTIITLCVNNSSGGTNISFAQGNPGTPAPTLVGPIVSGISSSTSGHFFITKVAADLWLLS